MGHGPVPGRGDLATGPQTDTKICSIFSTIREYGTAFILTLSLKISYG